MPRRDFEETAIQPTEQGSREAGYLDELTRHWRPMLAATVGLATGYSFSTTMTSVMGPHLIAEFGWEKAAFASVHSLSLIGVAVYPFVGRLADRFGARGIAGFGIVALSLLFLLLSRMTGALEQYTALFLSQAVLGITTTATVYTRVVVRFVRRARGLALAIAISGPALMGAIGGPFFNQYVEANGWRDGYVLLSVGTFVCGLIAVALLPSSRALPTGAAAAVRPAPGESVYREVFRTTGFWILVPALFLGYLHQAIMLSQLNLVLQDNGVATADTSAMISAMFSGMFVGRYVGGLAVDRYPPHLVAAIGMASPAIGLFLIASPLDAQPVLTFAVFFLGLSFGAEGDIIAYIVARIFPVRIYSTVIGMKTSVVAIGSSVGALLMGATLTFVEGYGLYLGICGTSVLIASGLLLQLRRHIPDEIDSD